jgi:uncharacterized protein (DUF2267 family)
MEGGMIMSETGIDAFDTTLQKTSIWLNEVMEQMAWEDRHRAYSTLRAVLHALRDRLIPDEAVKLGTQLPMLIRGFYYEGWHPAGKPLKYRHKEDFLKQVTAELRGLERAELEKAVSAVFTVLSTEIPDGETQKVKDQLPAEVRELWH